MLISTGGYGLRRDLTVPLVLCVNQKKVYIVMSGDVH